LEDQLKSFPTPLRLLNNMRSRMTFSNWPQLILERALFRKTSLQVHRFGHMQMLVDIRAADSGSIITCFASP
jgi:hypothetical protein